MTALSHLNHQGKAMSNLELESQAKANVKRGAALLSVLMPDWHHKVDVKHLDIEDDQWCVLGQLFNNYFVGRDSLRLSSQDSFNHGFSTSEPGEWHWIEQAWREVIQERLLADKENSNVN